MTPVKLRHLETFFVVAEELHFGRAAARLRVAQPAVSQVIAALEEDVGVSLFDRSRRTVTLTAAGRVLLEEGRRAREALDLAMARARAAAVAVEGPLTVAFTAVCALGALPRVVSAFAADHPNVDLRLRSMGTAELCAALARGEVDVGLTVLAGEVAPLASEALTDEPLVALLSADHPFADAGEIGAAEVLQEPMVLMSAAREPAMHQAYVALCAACGVAPHVALELDQLEAMLAFVQAGFGVSLAPAVVTRLRFPGVVSVPVTPRVDAGIRVVWDPARCNAAARAFLKAMALAEREGSRGDL